MILFCSSVFATDESKVINLKLKDEDKKCVDFINNFSSHSNNIIFKKDNTLYFYHIITDRKLQALRWNGDEVISCVQPYAPVIYDCVSFDLLNKKPTFSSSSNIQRIFINDAIIYYHSIINIDSPIKLNASGYTFYFDNGLSFPPGYLPPVVWSELKPSKEFANYSDLKPSQEFTKWSSYGKTRLPSVLTKEMFKPVLDAVASNIGAVLIPCIIIFAIIIGVKLAPKLFKGFS